MEGALEKVQGCLGGCLYIDIGSKYNLIMATFHKAYPFWVYLRL